MREPTVVRYTTTPVFADIPGMGNAAGANPGNRDVWGHELFYHNLGTTGEIIEVRYGPAGAAFTIEGSTGPDALREDLANPPMRLDNTNRMQARALMGAPVLVIKGDIRPAGQ